MRPRILRRRAFVTGVAVAAFTLGLYFFRLPVLVGLGRLLVTAAPPTHADVLVVMRGDETYFDRALTAAELFHKDYADRIYVSSALVDLGSTALRQRGLKMPSAQDNVVSILLQQNVPCDRIIVDTNAPGGGTLGEVRRLAAIMERRNFWSALVVTSWFHTRRTKWIINDVLQKTKKSAVVVIADSPIGPQNWWTYRYTAIAVLEEFFKLGLYGMLGEGEFADDSPAKAYAGGDGFTAGCPRTL